MKLFLSFLFILSIGWDSQAQKVCGTDIVHNRLLSTDQSYQQKFQESRQMWSNYIKQMEKYQKKPVLEDGDTIFEIPIVVHIIHTGGAIGTPYNKSDEDISEWIEYTNAIFEGTAPGYVGEGSGGTKIPIRLVLAKRDENCNATTGINRVNGSTLTEYMASGLSIGGPGVEEADIRDLIRWDPSSFYNIYIVNKINGADGYSGSSSYVAGFAYLPWSPLSVDGSFMLSSTVDIDNNTFAHEMGHAFGLLHTFEGGGEEICPPVETDCTTEGDEVCDTEISGYTFGPCPDNSDINSCTGIAYNNVQYNVMNYGNCPNRFTPGQKERVRMFLDSLRMGLVNSLALDDPSTTSLDIEASDCTPSSITESGNGYNVGPCSVSFGSINYSSGGYTDDGYEFYIDHTDEDCQLQEVHTSVALGEDVDLTISTIWNVQNIKAYIDYNNDGAFSETDELVFDLDDASPGTHTISVSIPTTVDAMNTPLRMRVISDVIDVSSCYTPYYGQVEDFAVTIFDATLDIQLVSFDIEANPCSANLSWSIGDPEEGGYFIIQRSMDGKNFEDLLQIASEKGKVSYSYEDKLINEGSYLYRLKMKDNDGSVSYSHTAVAQIQCQSESFSIYPNPNDGTFSVRFNESIIGPLDIYISDVLGRKVWSDANVVSQGTNELKLNVPDLTSGHYFIEIKTGTNTQMSRFVVR